MPLKIFSREDKTLLGDALLGLRAVFEQEHGIEIQYLNGLAKIEAVRPGMLRIRVTKNSSWPEKISDAVVAKPEAGYQLERKPDQIIFSTEKLKVLVPDGPFRFEIYDHEGKLLSRDFPGLGPIFGEDNFNIHRHIFPDERFYGLGERYGSLDRRGKRWIFWNTDVGSKTHHRNRRYTSIPFFISLRPDAISGWFIDHPGLLTIDLAKKYKTMASFSGSGVDADIYYLNSDSVKGLLKLAQELLGKSFFPPLWALGYQQSRYSYRSQEEVLKLADKFESSHIPLSVIHMDIHYMDKFQVFTVDRKRFPDLAGMAKTLEAKGVKLVCIIDPGLKVSENYAPYQEARAKGYLCADEAGKEFQAYLWPKKSALPDFFQEPVRSFWADQHKDLFEQGISGIWNDMNEPSLWKNEIRFNDYIIPFGVNRPPKMMHKVGERAVKHIECRNIYGSKECAATVDAFKKFRPGMRHFILSRSGFAGIHRFAAVWTADNESTFQHLAVTIQQILSWGLSGVNFTGADIGGFAKDCTPELFARWIELGAFYPFCRTHSCIRTKMQDPFQFGPEVEAISKKYIDLRCRLLPMIYSMFWENLETGLPLWRPLWMEFPDDHPCREVEEQFMFGEFLMTAPMLKEKAREKKVYLPAGDWLDFWEEKIYQGPGWHKLEAKLDRMPILVREGAIIVSQADPGQKMPWPELIIDVFPGAGEKETCFKLYEDDGVTEKYLQGEFSLREFRLAKSERGVIFSISKKEGAFPVPTRKAHTRIHNIRSKPSLFLDQKPVDDFKWSEEKNLLELEIMLDDSAHNIFF